MRKLVLAIATIAMTMAGLSATASANYDNDGGTYPPKPVQIIVESPTIPYGSGFWAKGKGLCVGEAWFVIELLSDPNVNAWYGPYEVNEDGDSGFGWVYHQFTPDEIAQFTGPIRIWVKQYDCGQRTSTIVNITKPNPAKPFVKVEPNPVAAGSPFTASAKNMCLTEPVVFAVQSTLDWTDRWFSDPVPVNPDGTASFTFPADVLPGGPGDYTVYAKQLGCDIIVTTLLTVNGTPAPSPSLTIAPTTVTVGSDFTASAKNLCLTQPVTFAVQSTADWTQRWFSDPVKVDPDGTASFTFPADVLPGGAGTYTVYAKQLPCDIVLTTTLTVTPAPTSTKEGGPTTTTTTSVVGSNGPTPGSNTPAPTVGSQSVTPQVLSAGLTAGATSATARAGDSLPVTGSEPTSTLRIALTALVAGIGMMVVASMRRRAVHVRSR